MILRLLQADAGKQGIKHVDMVPSLSAKNLECINIGKDFMVSHGYIKNDFDVAEWAAPEFLERAVREWLEEEWERKSWTKLPEGATLEEAMKGRLGKSRIPRGRSAKAVNQLAAAGFKNVYKASSTGRG